eukprot:TRINITY_DN35135_c0_g1_i1.p1 TRINITY_DN35135_c0_g1~~TRINITY_DN35135_c0_g1_i1.p1  ORF type:complete len:698 (+),score=145.27 TRINITY_DN35135_c0_g1_i1:75-2168(+)
MSSSLGRDRHAGNASPSQRPAPPKTMSKKREMKADFLLNFHRPPAHQRPQSSNYAPPPRRSRPGRARAPASFAKGRFVQSSFRLYVEDSATPDVVEAAVDADAMLDWSSVRRVDLICEQQPKCPICLELELVVPKITRCGHLFCFPCVMRYFLTLKSYNGKVYQQCPVCKEQVCPDELISARLEMVLPLREGSNLNFVLARKDIGSTLVRPANATAPYQQQQGDETAIQLPYQGDDGWRLSRMILLAPEEAQQIYQQELEELACFRKISLAEGDTELIPSTTAATELLERQWKDSESHTSAIGRRSRVSSGGSESVHEHDDLLPPPAVAVEREASDGSDGDDALDTSDAAKCSAPASSSTSPIGRPSTSPGLHPAQGRGMSFYQAADGRAVFLQPFFTKLLLHEHGGRWDKLPLELQQLRLERVHEETICEETRKRHKFLSHLPLGTSISFAEVDLRNHLSKETKEVFADDFAKRRQQRKKDQNRARNQERLSKARAAEEEERFYNSLNVQPVVVQALPTKEDFAASLSGRIEEGDPNDDTTHGDGEDEDGAEAPTLADKIKERMSTQKRREHQAKEQRNYFPELGGGSSASTSSAWGPGLGSRRTAPQKDAGAVKAAGAQDSVGPVTPMEVQPSFGEALEAALRRSSAPEVSSASAAASASAPDQDAEIEAGTSGGGSGKKKKGRAGKATTIRLFG